MQKQLWTWLAHCTLEVLYLAALPPRYFSKLTFVITQSSCSCFYLSPTQGGRLESPWNLGFLTEQGLWLIFKENETETKPTTLGYIKGKLPSDILLLPSSCTNYKPSVDWIWMCYYPSLLSVSFYSIWDNVGEFVSVLNRKIDYLCQRSIS